MTGRTAIKNIVRLMSASLCLMLVIAMSACYGGKEQSGPKQVPYYIAVVLAKEKPRISPGRGSGFT